MTIKDDEGKPFDGNNTYKLNVPVNAPVKQYWSATVYDRATHVYAAGLEFNVLHPKIRTSIGLRWLDEFSAKNRFEGNTFLITIGYIIKSLEKKEEKK